MEEEKQLYNQTKNFQPQRDFDPSWIADNQLNQGIDFTQKLGFKLCDYIEDKGGKLKAGRNALSNSQIRNVFGEAKRIQMKVGTDPDSWEKEKVNFTLLKPKLAYAAGRAGNKDKIHELRPVLDQAIDAVKPNEAGAIDRMNTFVQFLEAILAYHKAYGGKDN